MQVLIIFCPFFSEFPKKSFDNKMFSHLPKKSMKISLRIQNRTEIHKKPTLCQYVPFCRPEGPIDATCRPHCLVANNNKKLLIF